MVSYLSIINNMRYTSSPNAINKRGRKLCPITMDILTCNNSIIIEGVIYSTKGFSEWVRRELEMGYDRLVAECNVSEIVKRRKAIFIQYLQIRSPMTNLYYGLSTVSDIYDIFINKCNIPPMTCVYNFIHNILR